MLAILSLLPALTPAGKEILQARLAALASAEGRDDVVRDQGRKRVQALRPYGSEHRLIGGPLGQLAGRETVLQLSGGRAEREC